MKYSVTSVILPDLDLVETGAGGSVFELTLPGAPEPVEKPAAALRTRRKVAKSK